MAVKLSEEENPYSRRTPFDVLGVSPSATARDLREAQVEKLEEINYADYDDQTRIAKRDEINEAYSVLRDVRSRMSVVIFRFDQTVGKAESRSAAEKHKTLKFEFGRILQGTDKVFPVSPELAKPTYKRVALKRSVRYRKDVVPTTVDPKAQALASITFDR